MNYRQSIGDYLFKAISKYPNLIAIKIGERSISYQELNESAFQVAEMIFEANILNETIGVVGQRSASSYFGILGILYSGCNYTPLNTKYSKERLLKIMTSSNVKCVIGDKEDLIEFFDIIGCDYLINKVIIPEGDSPKDKNWISIIKSNTIKAPIQRSDENELAYILFTSGSTGMPKGVKVSNSNVIEFIKGMNEIYKLDVGFKASQTFDLSFDPSVSDMFFTWSNGGVLCVLPEDEKMSPNEYINREKINFWNSVPSLATFMYRMGSLTPAAFPTLQYSMFCGEQFPKQIADAWKIAAPNSTIENLYGPTETTIYISRYNYDINNCLHEFKNSIVPIGHPFPNQKVVIIDSNNNPVNVGEVGEICFKGSQVSSGYLNDNEKTNKVFVNFDWDTDNQFKWYKTGDLGFVNTNHEVECIGRVDSQIKIAGRRIEIGEIESVLRRFEKISDIIIVAVRDSSGIVIGCVGFTLFDISKKEEIDIRKQSEIALERVFFPKKIIKLVSFPLTISGKIDRAELVKISNSKINY